MAAEQAALEMEAQAAGERLAAHYRDVYLRAMADVPICNLALDVAATGFRPFGGRFIGIVTTPWFMNVVLVPPAAGSALQGASGETVPVALPAGKVDFLIGELAGFGRILTCSLFSPMDAFEDQAAALAAAEAALAGLLDVDLLAGEAEPEVYPTSPKFAPEPDGSAPLEVPSASKTLDRRALLRGGLRADPPGAP
jgi:[NiFe] hydrogenase assembly HybE family chaperone